jgi:hypothetical protein
METGMNARFDDTSRAFRLLRWYPASWRDRYGEEFVDHMEQELAERPVHAGRTMNIAYKGLVARIGDVGLAHTTTNAKSRTRVAVGTGFVLTVPAAILMLNFWSRAMGLWNSFHEATVPVSVATGILTVATGLLVVVLALMVLVVAVCVLRQIILGRARGLWGPSILAVGSGAFLLFATHHVPVMITQYVHGAHGFKGVRLSHPGQVIKALAQVTWEVTQNWVAIWNQNLPGPGKVQVIVDDLLPLALVAFGVAFALLVRRVELPHVSERLTRSIVISLGALTGVFLITYIVWSVIGGLSGAETYSPESPWLGIAYFVYLAFVVVLTGRCSLLAAKPRRDVVIITQGNA